MFGRKAREMGEKKWRKPSEREEGFVEIPPAVREVKNQIVIPHKELHPEVKEKVADVLFARALRSKFPLIGGGIGIIAGNAFLASVGRLIGQSSDLTPTLKSVPLSLVLVYKSLSPLVRSRTKEVGTASKRFGFLDAAGRYKSDEVRKTHLAYVDWKGNVVLKPRTPEEEKLYRRQQTFWKHFIPGRARFEP